MSIGCLITSDGQKLPSILVTKGLTNRSVRKYGKYQNDPRCILTQSSSGWFCQDQVKIVLESIHKHMKGQSCLCVWDAYKSHQTSKIKDLALKLNITLLTVPRGMTSHLQPLDFKINGPYKAKMSSHWIRNGYNYNDPNFHQNLCETILTCYDDFKSDLIVDFRSLVVGI